MSYNLEISNNIDSDDRIISNSNNIECFDTNNEIIDNYFNKQYKTGPKITYIIEPPGAKFDDAKRVIAIAFSYSNKYVQYGACIFRKIDKKDTCIKSQIRDTAIKRFNSSPVLFSIENNNMETDCKHNKIVENIRYKMYKHGVKSK